MMMTLRGVYFIVVLAIFISILLGTGTHYFLRNRRHQKLRYGNFEMLLKKLAAVPRDNVALIARDLVYVSGDRRTDEDDLDLPPSQIWPLIGGLDGLEVLERNCSVLVDLVFYVQQSYPEALAVAEQLRLNTSEIQWHISRLKAAAKTGKLESSFPDNAQRAVTTYFVMTRRVLALYEHLNLPGFAELQKAL